MGSLGENASRSKANVCVTGGTGYIGSSLIRRLLLDGYSVRATVRNPEDVQKTAFLRELEGAKERLSIVRADLMEEGSFDAALKGVQGVFHVAGPVVPKNPTGDYQVDMIDPTVKGTLNVLRSCLKSSSLQRVVMTSSCSAIRYADFQSSDIIALNETNWSSTDFCKAYQMWYALAKTVAEREAWKFAEENNIDLVVVNPAYVVGPFLGTVPTSTVGFILTLLDGTAEYYPDQVVGFVHIDDVVDTHILVFEKAEASGRYICSSLVGHWYWILTMIRNKYPTLQIPTRCKKGYSEVIAHTMDTNKVEQLGLKTFKSVGMMFDDCIHDYILKGLLPPLSTQSDQG